MTNTTEGNNSPKKCAECSSPIEGGLERALQHYLIRHPARERFIEIVNHILVEVDCLNCGEPLISELSVGYESGRDVGRLDRKAYCLECIEEEPIKRLVVEKIRPEEVIGRQATLERLEEDDDG